MVRALHETMRDGPEPLPCFDVLEEGLRTAVLIPPALHDRERPRQAVQEFELVVVDGKAERDETLHARVVERPLEADPGAEGEPGRPELGPAGALPRESGRGREVPGLSVPSGVLPLATSHP